jgi:hypothetical protein
MAIPELFYFKFILIASHIHSSGEIGIPNVSVIQKLKKLKRKDL